MAVTSKSGNPTESFSVFKQKFGKQTAAFKGFKQHFSAITINHEKSSSSQRTNSVLVIEDEENVDSKRGFVPSDVLKDPNKREFLTQLSKRMWMEKEKFRSKCRESGSIQGSNSSNSILQKIMTPASAEFESGSLKRRDPKKMFTDSSFYNSKYHPTIADQVEMAHKLSSAMFTEQNKASKGAKMYLTRMENSGGFQDKETAPKHDTVPNMKLVMNPEGKVTDWDDLAPDQRPDYNQVAGHAAPGAPSLSLPEVADPVAESLNAGVGKGGELFAKRKKKAESWIVDDNSIGRAQPSAFADHFIKEQTQQQLAFQQEKQVEQQQKKQIFQQEAAVKEAEQLQQQQEAKQAFMQQQQFKQEQSMEIRKIQEMAQQQPDFPQDFQHTSLKARSFTPSLDLSCHNVQGINVWANTAPRGWSNTYTRSKATPTRGSAAPPSADNQMMASMEQEQQLRVQQQEEQLRIQQEEQFRIQQEQQLMIQQEEQLRIQQEEQFRIQQEQQMRIQQEQQLRIQQEEEQKRLQFEQEEMARKQEEEMRRQVEERMRQEQEMRLREEEEIRRQEEMRLQEERRRQEEQMRIQMQQQEEQRRLQEEQMRIQQQQEESMRIQMQQEEQYRMQAQQEEQYRMQAQQEEQYRMQAQQEEQYRMQAQKEEQMRVEMQQQELMQQQQKKATKTQGFSYGVKQADISHIGPKDAQLAMPPMSSSVFESSQSQTFSSVQESSTSFSQSSHSTNQIYESQEFNGGVMKGYKAKEEFSSEQSQNGEGRNVRDSGIFTGINGDSNALVDEEFDRKKHTVKDLAKHFALVKPKQNIPHNILPEQKMYNGDHGPALNYLGASEGGLVQSQARREMSQQDVEASKAAYEMKKKQQLEQQQSSTTTTTTASSSSSSTVVKRMESSSSSEQQQKSERRMSLRDSLMLDPAQAHADAGIIDPSAILRGSEGADGRATSEGILNQSTVQGETDKILNKWDNHNTIARGWAGVQANYHPVTFRKMYNVDNQKQTVAL